MSGLKRVGGGLASAGVIARGGLFDPRWYTAQLDRPVASASLALVHYVTRGRRAGLSPCPLFEPSWYAPRDWRTRQVDPLAALLRRGADATASPHPLFDPATWTAAHPEAAGHRSGPLGHFLAVAGPDTPLPLDPAAFAPFAGSGPERGPVTWGAARQALDGALATFRRDERRRRAPRVVPGFDHEAAAELVARCALHPLPEPDGPGVPLVSVILPVHDRREQVRAAVASVQAQTLADWELLAVDDGSTDGSGDVLRELAAADPRIRVLATPRTLAAAAGDTGDAGAADRAPGGVGVGGVCVARNVGAAAARGRYVAWLDSDNRWTPDFLRTMVVTMAAQDAPVAYAAAEIVQATGRRYRAFDPGGDPAEVLALLEVANHVDLNVLVVRRDLLDAVGGFDESLRRTVDYDLVWRLARRAVPRYVGVVGVVYDADHEAADRITVRERASWREVVKSRRLVDWPGLARAAADRPPGRLSVVVVADRGWPAAWVSVTSVLRAADPRDDVEVLVVDDGGRRPDALVLSTLPLLDPRVRFLRTPVRSGRPLAVNLALAASTGSVVALLAAGVEVWPGWSAPLVAALADPGTSAAAPLVLTTDGTLLHAGLVDGDEPGAGPVPALAGFAVEDARRGGERLEVRAAGDEAVAIRAADLIAAGGLDPLYVAQGGVPDLCLRLPGRTVVATAAVTDVAHRLRPGVALPATATGPVPDPAVRAADREQLARRLAERVAEPVAGGTAPADPHGAGRPGAVADPVGAGRDGAADGRPGDQVRAVLRQVRERRTAGAPGTDGPAATPCLRWAIRTALPVGPDAVRWGDLHFAGALAVALERLGQQVVVDHRPAIDRRGPVPDDVVLVLRGLEPAPDRPPARDGGDAVRITWVISHPRDVTDAELRGADRVFAASQVWAARAGERAGVEVLPLLQATDPARFHPGAAEPDSGDEVLFVGNSRNVFRPVVRDLLAAGVDVAIYGDKWDRFLGPGRVRGRFVPNDRLAAAYASAGVVLNDHWDDMRADGFVSNRLFDAAACGARVVSDHIPGVEELFGGLVRTFTDADRLVRLVKDAPAGFPDAATRAELAARVLAEHSFAARARTLLEEVLRLRG